MSLKRIAVMLTLVGVVALAAAPALGSAGAALSLGGGLINVPGWLEPLFPRAGTHHDFALVAISVGAGAAGIVLAWLFYVARPELPGALAEKAGTLYRLVYNKYFVDEIYDAAVVRPLVGGSRAFLWRGVDVGVIDGAANGIGRRARSIGGLLRQFQSGYIRSYAAWVLLGCVAALLGMGLAGGGR